MRRTGKKVWSILLTLALLLSLLPVGVLALSGSGTQDDPWQVSTEEELKEAVTDATGQGSYIKLTAGISLTSAVTISGGKVVTLDLNGQTVNCGQNITKMFTITGSGTSLTICDSSEGQQGKILADRQGYNMKILYLTSKATAALESGCVESAEGIKATELQVSTGTTFTLSGGTIRSSDQTWYNTAQVGTVYFRGGTVYADGATGVAKKLIDYDQYILIHQADGAFVVQNKNEAPPTDFHVNYNNRYYDCYGTLSDASSAMQTSYEDSSNQLTVTINPEGSGTAPSVVMNSDDRLNFILNDGASISKNGTDSIKLKAGTVVTVTGGTVAEGAIEAYTDGSPLRLVTSTKGDVTTYTAEVPPYFQVGDQEFTDMGMAIDAIAGQGTITLLENGVRVPSITVPAGKDITLDLGGKELSINNVLATFTDTASGEEFVPAVDNQGSLTIKTGTLYMTKDCHGIVNRGSLTIAADAVVKSDHSYGQVIANLGGRVTTAGTVSSWAEDTIATYGGTVDITGGSVSASRGSVTAITIFNRTYNSETGANQGAVVTVSGGRLSGTLYAASTNAIRSAGSRLTITGGTLSSVRSNIYWAADAALTIGTEGLEDGPTLTAENGSCVDICGGTLTIYGGQFSASGSQGASDEQLLTAFRSNSGSGNLGDALTVVAARSDAYPDALSVAVHGGTLSSSTGYGLRYFNCNLADGAAQVNQTVSVSVTGGSFSGQPGGVDAEFVPADKQAFVTGGAFSADPSDYLSSGYRATSVANVYQVSPDVVAVRFDANGGTVDTTELQTNADGTIDTLPQPVWAGHNFTGWFTAQTGGEKVTAATVFYQETTTVYAQWDVVTHTVTFNPGEGSGTMDAQVVPEGPYTLPESTFTAPSGKVFDVWAAGSVDGTQAAAGGTYTLTADTTFYALWKNDPNTGSGDTGSGGVSGGGGTGGSSSGGSGSTTSNPDGSTTTTVTQPDGTTTETTKNPDGSQQVVETQPDGTTTTTTTDTAGNKTETVEQTDGSSTTTVENKDGSGSTTTVSAQGQVEVQVSLPDAVVADAAQAGEAVSLPMPAVSAATDAEGAPAVTVSLPGSSTTAKVEIPVEDVTAGTVAVLVKEDGSQEVIKTTVTTENGIAVTLNDGDTVLIVDNSKDFADVSEGYWGETFIDFAVSRGLFAGTGEDTFSPETAMSRAMIVTVLASFDGVDTAAGSTWYEASQQWAMEQGISDGSNMHDSLTREQLAVMLWRYAGSPAAAQGLEGYADGGDVSAWAGEAMAWAVEQGLISGTGGSALDPQGRATRAQVATILMRFVETVS